MNRPTRLFVVLVLNVVLVAGLVVVGDSAHSVGMLAEGADYLADAAAIGVSLLAIWLANRPTTERRPIGYPRATTFAALVNGGWLLMLSVLVIAGAADRLTTGTPHVQGLPVLVASGVAGMVMLIAALLLGGDIDDQGDEDLNVRAVLLDTAADAAAAAGVAVSGAIILAAHGLYWLDPTVALGVAIVVTYHATRLLVEVYRKLGTGPPKAAADSQSMLDQSSSNQGS